MNEEVRRELFRRRLGAALEHAAAQKLARQNMIPQHSVVTNPDGSRVITAVANDSCSTKDRIG